MEPFSYQLWFAVRYVHVVCAGLLAGGALMVCATVLAGSGTTGRSIAGVLAPAYEWVFWSLAGVIVATGISNLGLKGDGLLGPDSQWGRALVVKLATVLAVLALSLIRTDFVLRCRRLTTDVRWDRARATMAALYALTVVALLGALWIGLGLAHGRY